MSASVVSGQLSPSLFLSDIASHTPINIFVSNIQSRLTKLGPNAQYSNDAAFTDTEPLDNIINSPC